MYNNLYIAIYWGPREVNWENDIERIMASLNKLSHRETGNCHWYNAKQVKGGNVPIKITFNTILDIVKRGGNKDYYKKLIPDLGYRFLLKSNPNFNKSNNISFFLGAYNQACTNCIVFHYQNGVNVEITNFVTDFFHLIQTWNPDFGIISHNIFDVQIEEQSKSNKLKMGLINYNKVTSIIIPNAFTFVPHKIGTLFYHNSSFELNIINNILMKLP